jgi:hypothetical protein
MTDGSTMSLPNVTEEHVDPLPKNEGTLDQLLRAEELASHDPGRLTDYEIQLIACYSQGQARKAVASRRKAREPVAQTSTVAKQSKATTHESRPTWTATSARAFIEAFDAAVDCEASDHMQAAAKCFEFAEKYHGLRVSVLTLAPIVNLLGGMNRRNHERNQKIAALEMRIHELEAAAGIKTSPALDIDEADAVKALEQLFAPEMS